MELPPTSPSETPTSAPEASATLSRSWSRSSLQGLGGNDRPNQAIVSDHPEEHGHDKEKGRADAERQRRDSRTGAEAGDPPADAENRGAEEQRCIDGGLGRQTEAPTDQRPRQQPRQPAADRGNDHAAGQDEDETWIPGSRNVKEAANAMWVEHPGARQAETEKAAGNESGDGAQDHHATPPMRMR